MKFMGVDICGVLDVVIVVLNVLNVLVLLVWFCCVMGDSLLYLWLDVLCFIYYIYICFVVDVRMRRGL